MTDTTTIGLLITAVAGLTTALVYVFKKGENREKETQQMVKDVLNALRSNEGYIKNSDEVLKRVEKLLTNWRGH
jgi:Na+-translocating ferredoxin:NAD+ oxidoreductase RnfG subunit